MSTATDFQSLMLIDSDFESILTNPILDIAARFWDEERYEVFKVCYRSMREIDDLIDNRKSTGEPITIQEQKQFDDAITNWTKEIAENTGKFPFQKILTDFKIPLWPWERLGKAMIYDVSHDGFRTFRLFLRYAEGAAISPASVFVHLCGVRKDNNSYVAPNYDIRKAARHLAVFSYLVHILRDFEKDQKSNLNYFADDILVRLGIHKVSLREYAYSKQSDKKLIELFKFYKSVAGFYQRKAVETFTWLLPVLEPRYQLSLKVIYSLYSQIFDKIDPENDMIFQNSIPSPAEIQQQIDLTVSSFEPAK